jgi:hypothetical protein
VFVIPEVVDQFLGAHCVSRRECSVVDVPFYIGIRRSIHLERKGQHRGFGCCYLTVFINDEVTVTAVIPRIRGRIHPIGLIVHLGENVRVPGVPATAREDRDKEKQGYQIYSFHGLHSFIFYWPIHVNHGREENVTKILNIFYEPD